LGLTWFSEGSPGTSGCAWRHIGRFLEYDHGRSPPTNKYYPEPHYPSVSLMDVQKDFGRMRETQVTNTELNWLYSALIARQPIGSGCCVSMLVISLRPRIPRNPEHLTAGTSLGFDYMKQEKYISEYERGGFKVAKVNLPLPDGRLRLFLERKEDWLEEGLLVPVKKK
jgi:hypothetical protein